MRAPRPARPPLQTTVAADQAKHIAGTQGDALQVVQNLPGLARPAFGSGQLVVWGSAPRDTRIYVDGVEIPALYHGGAIRSTVNGDLVRSVQLVPGAFGADYGRGLGGLVKIETRALRDDGTHGHVAADTLDASAMASVAPLSSVRVAAAARYGYLDRLLPLVTSRGDIGDYFPIPQYRDYQAKATVDLDRDEEASLVFLGSSDDLRRSIPSPDPAHARAETTSSSFHRLYLRYTRTTDDGAQVDVTPFAGYDTSALAATFGDRPTRLDIDTTRYGVRASHRSRIAPWASTAFGLDALGSASSVKRAGTLTLPPREGDVTVFGQPAGDDFAVDDWSTHILDVAPYVVADFELGKLIVTPSARFDAYLLEASRLTPRIGSTPALGTSRLEGAIDPRLALAYRATPELTLTASGGQYHQAPEPEDLSAVFGTPNLTLSRALHGAVGESLKVTRTLSLETTLFYKRLYDLPVRTRLAPHLARALVQDGEGRSFGLQVLLRQQLSRGLFGWASYTLSRSERKYVYDDAWRRFDFDQPHVFTAVLSQELGHWTLGARFRYASGAPRTPVVGAYYDVKDDRHDPLFGPQGSIRLPDFYALDLRVERTFDLGGGASLGLYADLLNVTFHQNKEEILYSSDYRARGYVTGLPTLAVIGARLER